MRQCEKINKIRVLWRDRLYRRFIRFVGLSKDKTTRNLFLLFGIALFACLLVFLIGLSSLHFDKCNASFGTFGDFYGGVLNPILTFLTFMGLLITIVIQQKELRETRKENKKAADSLSNQVALALNTTYKSDIYTFLADTKEELSNFFKTRQSKDFIDPLNGKKSKYTVNVFDELKYDIERCENQDKHMQDVTINSIKTKHNHEIGILVALLTTYYELLHELTKLNTNITVLKLYDNLYSWHVHLIRILNVNFVPAYDHFTNYLNSAEAKNREL